MDKDRQIRLLYPPLVLLAFSATAYPDWTFSFFVWLMQAGGSAGSISPTVFFTVLSGLAVYVLIGGFILGAAATVILNLRFVGKQSHLEADLSHNALTRISMHLGILPPEPYDIFAEKRIATLSARRDALSAMSDLKSLDEARTIEVELSKLKLSRKLDAADDSPFHKIPMELFKLFAAATFDHEMLSKGVHTWIMRRWHSFRVASSSAISLAILLIATLSFVPLWLWLNQGWASIRFPSLIWYALTGLTLWLLAEHARASWRETQGMLEFQALRSFSEKEKNKTETEDNEPKP